MRLTLERFYFRRLGTWQVLLGLTCACIEMAGGAIPQYTSRVWQMEDGLPHTIVQAITQTHDGYLWVGTREGLARFDGLKFLSFTARDFGSELLQPSVTHLCETPDGSLWIGTENMGLFRLQRGKMTRFGNAEGLKSEAVYGLQVSPDGSLWIAAGGLARFKEGKLDYPFATQFAGFISTMFLDHEGTIWIGGEGLRKLVDGKLEICIPRSGRFPGTPRCLARDREGTLWAGENYGLAGMEDGKVTYQRKGDGPAGIVGALLPDREGNLWVGAYSGLSLFVEGHYVPPSDEPLGLDRVFCLFQDWEGSVWAGSEAGLVRFTPRQITSYTKENGLTADSIGSVCASRDGSVWVSVWGGGLNRFENGTFTAFCKSNGLSSNFILAIHEARDGSLWVGADWGAGLDRLRDGRIVTRFGKAQGLDPVTTALLEDAEGNLWIGSRDSLACFKDGNFQHYTTRDGLSGNKINGLCERQEGGIWVGTEEGLTQWWQGRFINLAASEPRLKKTILSLYEDPELALWVGTRGAGVVRLKGGVLSTFTSRQGLLSDSIYAILEDDRKNLWFNSSKGIFRVGKGQLEEMIRGTRATLHCVWYCKTAQYREVTQPAATRALDGRLWFRTTHGVVVVDPNTPINTVAPPVAIETILADKRDLSEVSAPWVSENLPLARCSDQPLTLPRGRGELEFRYTALSLHSPEMNRFKYRLEPVDADWVEAGPRRVAHYNSLSPGRYRFSVVACNNDGVWNDTGAALSLVLKPHFTQSWWFLGLCGMTATALIGGAARYSTWRKMHAKVERLEKRHTIEVERARIARDLHDHLGSRLTEMLMLTEFSLHRIDEGGEMVKPRLQQSASLVRELAEGLDTIVWAVDPKNDTLDNFVLYLYEYLDRLASISPVRILRDVPSGLQEYPLSSMQRHNLFLVLKEALTNVFKHSNASEVWFRLRLESARHADGASEPPANDTLTISIADNGRGFVPEATSELGNGLLNMKKRMNLINGVFELTSEPGAGTRICLRIPLQQSF